MADARKREASVNKVQDPLLVQARRFLREEEIKDAPTEKKEQFLRSKGLTKEQVATLLKESNKDAESQEADPMPASIAPAEDPSPPEDDTVDDPSDSKATERSSTAQQNPVPPIIMYPEFLARRQQKATPSPFITTQNLLYTLYVGMSAYAVTYAGSEYVVQPMLQQLNEARHIFQNYTNDKLHTFTDKLETMVSKAPLLEGDNKVPSEQGDVDDDITACFHQNAATQTSPGLEYPSVISPLKEEGIEISAAQNHTSRLRSLQSHLSSLDPTSATRDPHRAPMSMSATSGISGSLKELRQFLDALPYDSNMARNAQADKAENVQATLKGEIRAMKGTFLSAKNFPSGTRGIIGAT